MPHQALFRALNDSVWPILPQKMEAIVGFLNRRLAGVSLDAKTLETLAAGTRTAAAPSMNRSVAVLPIHGTICQRAGLLDEASGGCSTETIGRQFDALMKDDTVGCVILDVDSPGGHYCGTPELADKIFSARGTKPICAVANSMAASAAYWIASAADELVVTPSGDVGSIGVLAMHMDQSAWNEQTGLKPTYVTYGKFKAEMNPDQPLSAEALGELQRRVDDAGETFVRAVARNRGVTPAVVKSEFGQGRCVGSKEAVQRGMADRVDTLEATIARLASGGKKARGGKSAGTLERERLALEKFRS
jgi:capsid assembly protease